MATKKPKSKLLTVKLKAPTYRKFRSYVRKWDTSMTAMVQAYVESVVQREEMSLGDK